MELFDRLLQDPTLQGQVRATQTQLTFLLEYADKTRPLLHMCLGMQMPHIATWLLENGYDPNIKDSEGCNALFYILRPSYIPVARLLVAKGADVHCQSTTGHTPLSYAVMTRCHELVDFMAEIVLSARPVPPFAIGPIRHAIVCNDADIVYTLMRHGYPVNALSKDLVMPLLLAITYSRFLMVHSMITMGADPLAPSAVGSTSLHHACSLQTEPAMLALLLKHSAHVNPLDDEHNTPLHCLCMSMFQNQDVSIALLNLLLSRGADLFAANKNNATPMELAKRVQPCIYDCLQSNPIEFRLCLLSFV